MDYVGRFAPSPTGPLHFGSLVAAVASYLDAKAHGGSWLVRMEDVDITRCSQEASDAILTTLDAFGLHWDGEVVYQSQRTDLYHDVLTELIAKQRVYPCGCSRKEIADSGLLGIDGVVYPGTCRHGLDANKTARAWRFNVQQCGVIAFEDAIQGTISQHLAQQVGDFVLKRADGLFAYQLAVVVDDHLQGVTDIVRGADLLDSTPRQIALQQALGYVTPHYAHIPVATNDQGEKLSKQTLATPINTSKMALQLQQAMRFLGLPTDSTSDEMSNQALLEWGVTQWKLSNVPKQRHIPCLNTP